MSRSYERLPVVQFGRQMIISGDLDPLYVALPPAFEGERDKLSRWLIAYWCFYHAGLASYLCRFEGKEFWKNMMEAAKNETEAPVGGRWPRAKERRHFRGVACVKAVRDMWGKYMHQPEQLVTDLIYAESAEETDEPIPFSELSKRVLKLPLFGPWIAFKVGDMLDRVMDIPVNFEHAHIFMFKDPVKGAEMVWREHNGFDDNVKPKDQEKMIQQVVSHLDTKFNDLMAPPFHDRKVGLQEIETVLCKWKSHMNGHYPVNNDLVEIAEGLEPWASKFEEAEAVLQFLPKVQ